MYWNQVGTTRGPAVLVNGGQAQEMSRLGQKGFDLGLGQPRHSFPLAPHMGRVSIGPSGRWCQPGAPGAPPASMARCRLRRVLPVRGGRVTGWEAAGDPSVQTGEGPCRWRKRAIKRSKVGVASRRGGVDVQPLAFPAFGPTPAVGAALEALRPARALGTLVRFDETL